MQHKSNSVNIVKLEIFYYSKTIIHSQKSKEQLQIQNMTILLLFIEVKNTEYV